MEGQLAQALRSVGRRSEDLVRILEVATVEASEAGSLEDALRFSILYVCGYTGWEVGHAQLLQPDPISQRAKDVWHLDEPERYETFRAATENSTFSAGEGLRGQVIET